ncbi:MFS transporter [Leucobacter sp. wl10]|uniref:MFS transporter n=1 Tax=Leucobacter sp. wl10 TaxID=2304677 RepID=UPI000E5A7C28|nr:MFS transporter [Leucobacter sp. wl10]RGE18818.1 MFS transporter [Leucobacter sp. wl10]
MSAVSGRAVENGAQRRIVAILSLATVLGGLGVGASLSAGALLIAEVTGNDALSGLGSTMNAVGAALAGMPLARLAARRGRRVALASGNAVAVLGAVAIIAASAAGFSPLLFAGLAVLGVASAVQLQSRFAAADLAVPENRARDLSLVVWSITVGAVIGPNLITPGEILGEALGLPGLAGIFIFTIGAQLSAGIVVWCGLRPDPLLESRRLAEAAAADGPSPRRSSTGGGPGGRAPQFLAIALIALAHATMVSVMAMTPLQIAQHGGGITLVGLTISLHIAGMYALSPVFGMLSGRIGARPVLLLGFSVLALAVLGAGLGGESMPVVQVALVLLGIGWSMVTVAGSALLTEVTPVEARPRRQGQSDTAMNAAGAAAGGASGLVFAIGGFPVLAAVAGALVVLGVSAAVSLRGRRQSID